jgi:hypothetical protein
MSRQIDFTKPLSEKDREYLHMRGEHARVEQMDQDFPPEGTDEEAVRPNWESMKLAELQAEVARVNTEYGRDLSDAGTKAELTARLDEWWNEPDPEDEGAVQ